MTALVGAGLDGLMLGLLGLRDVERTAGAARPVQQVARIVETVDGEFLVGKDGGERGDGGGADRRPTPQVEAVDGRVEHVANESRGLHERPRPSEGDAARRVASYRSAHRS
ncbi:hypothetical protein [Pelagibacterium luteolum]|uniref:Uncharacterized protein n=1 Tax=Pelagibacterium luteolum TaxID=440168 RepID=A0A1G7ZUX8_9HYPH|nr:hypothetical protein [Pelagibacterium luteolum]SDH12453.1 hypothetical protein SAMN04487974_1236 [Pelagibacterium luteolum]